MGVLFGGNLVSPQFCEPDITGKAAAHQGPFWSELLPAHPSPRPCIHSSSQPAGRAGREWSLGCRRARPGLPRAESRCRQRWQESPPNRDGRPSSGPAMGQRELSGSGCGLRTEAPWGAGDRSPTRPDVWSEPRLSQGPTWGPSRLSGHHPAPARILPSRFSQNLHPGYPITFHV